MTLKTGGIASQATRKRGIVTIRLDGTAYKSVRRKDESTLGPARLSAEEDVVGASHELVGRRFYIPKKHTSFLTHV